MAKKKSGISRIMSWLNEPIVQNQAPDLERLALDKVTELEKQVQVLRSAPKKVAAPLALNPATDLPSTRQSIPQTYDNTLLSNINNRYKTIDPPFIREVIPVIRRLMSMNEDVGQAVHNVVTLGNTGHKVHFDKGVSPEMQAAMRKHLFVDRKDWATGTANMDGLVNKMFSQILVSGALSNEWVVNQNLTGIDACVLVNPEDIKFVLDARNTQYMPYQIVRNGYLKDQETGFDGLIKLNTNTYKYFAINGDTECPYGIPMYMPILDKIPIKTNMDRNIGFIIDQMGLIGFLECLITAPDELGDENSVEYSKKLEALLVAAKGRIQQGFKDGVVVGIKDDHEFEFHSLGKEISGAVELYKNNEMQLASGLKQDAALWGRDYNTSEAAITVVFMKMLSELKNIQNVVKSNLEFGYSLELRLAGFKFDYLKVDFNRSTISDDLKFQQAEEIKLRNVTTKVLWGLITQETAADEMGYEEPAEAEALVPYEVLAGGTDPAAIAAKAQGREADKNKSDKKVRDKNKPVAKNK